MLSHITEKIYLSSPVWIQNLLVSLYGALEHRRRYWGVFKRTWDELEHTESLSEPELRDLTNQRLTNILETAIRDVPYYRDFKLKAPNLADFPLLDRNSVAENVERLVSDKYNKDKLLTIYTGGSTGTPLKIYISKAVRQKTYAFWARFYKHMGFRIGEKKASFVGRKVQDPSDNRSPFWRYNIVDNQLVFSSFHLTDENLADYIEKLNRFKPKLIEGYPLSILGLAEYITDHDIQLSFRPVGLSTSSENFTPEQRKIMETAFSSPVFDQYGSGESVVFAGECSHGTMHVDPEYGVIEVLNDQGEIVQEGQGELIATTLLNDVMPLIRYRIGDLGEVSYKSCECGRHTPIIKQLHGKVGAVIVSGDRKVSAAAIAIAFEYLENIRKSQIIQDTPDEVLVRLVVKEGFSKENEDFLRWELSKMLGYALKINVDYVADIPPSDNGKYKMIIQNYYK